MNENKKFYAFWFSLIAFVLIVDLVDYYNQFSSAEEKCAVNEKNGWPNAKNKQLCDEWLPTIKKIKGYLHVSND